MPDNQKTQMTCTACGGGTFQDLPRPNKSQSMLSDGKIVPKAIDKALCLNCGLIRHRRQLKSEQVYAIYGEDYFLTHQTGEGDCRRAEQFADELSNLLPRKGVGCRFLDVGCGAGFLLSEVRNREFASEYVGIDPSLPPDVATADDNFSLINAFLGMSGLDIGKFEIVVSVNTIEHSADPRQFLEQLRDCLSPDGDIVVICPSNQPANVELLFYDHIWTLTPLSMQLFAKQAGLAMINNVTLGGALKDFKGYHFKHDISSGPDELMKAPEVSTAGDYLNAWAGLDKYLLDKIDEHDEQVQIFGAGQMAALLRTYAPKTFNLAKRLLVDQFEGAWPLGNISKYEKSCHDNDWKTVIAVHPQSQALVEKRILEDGGVPIRLPASIER